MVPPSPDRLSPSFGNFLFFLARRLESLQTPGGPNGNTRKLQNSGEPSLARLCHGRSDRAVCSCCPPPQLAVLDFCYFRGIVRPQESYVQAALRPRRWNPFITTLEKYANKSAQTRQVIPVVRHCLIGNVAHVQEA